MPASALPESPRRSAPRGPLGPDALLAAVLDQVDACVYVKDHEGRYLYVNPRVCELYGRTADEILGRHDADLLPEGTAERLARIDARVVSAHERQADEEVIVDASGHERHFWSIKVPLGLPGQATCLVGFSSDITELLGLRREVERQRTSDALTGLPNRTGFEAELDAELQGLDRERERLAVVLLDVDHFKFINTSLGTEVGHAVIRRLAERLRRESGLEGRIARLSGDEFVLRIAGVHEPGDAAREVEALRALVAQPFDVDGRVFQFTASAGIALWPEDGPGVATLLERAELAMYDAKERGRDQLRFYSREMGETARVRLELERDLRAAVAGGEFELHYQPKVRCKDQGFEGFEALVRWRHPSRGLVPPGQFIPLAEQLGLVATLGRWVMAEACRQMAAWDAEGFGPVSVAVNLSPAQMRDPKLAEDIRALLAEHGLGPDRLELEVTESMMMDDPKDAIALLRSLRAAGVRLSIDDFGTGYSSMAHLKHLPVSSLKLDRVFVQHIDSDRRDANLCAGVIALAHQLGLGVVAEGVETESQAKRLAGFDCDVFQGFLFSRPLTHERAGDYLRGVGITPRTP